MHRNQHRTFKFVMLNLKNDIASYLKSFCPDIITTILIITVTRFFYHFHQPMYSKKIQNPTSIFLYPRCVRDGFPREK